MARIGYLLWLSVFYLIWGSCLGLAADPEYGVIVEKVGSPSVLEKVGVQPGDVFLSWKLLPSPLLHKGSEGAFETVFHWEAFLAEQVPRGTVKLFGKRDERARV